MVWPAANRDRNEIRVLAYSGDVPPEARLKIFRDRLLPLLGAEYSVQMVFRERMCHVCRPSLTPPRENRACRGRRSGLLILNPTHSHLSRGGLQHTVATATTVWATPFGNPATDGTFSHVRTPHRLCFKGSRALRDVAGAKPAISKWQLAISQTAERFGRKFQDGSRRRERTAGETRQERFVSVRFGPEISRSAA